MSTKNEIKVLVTGFGPFLNITHNPSSLLLTHLPPSLPSSATHPRIKILTPPPLPAIYASLSTTLPTLLETHTPDIVLHIGLAVDRDYFAVERGAERDGYHQVPDETHKVIPKSYFPRKPKLPPRLDTYFNLDDVLPKWKSNLTPTSQKVKGKGEVDLRASDDVGSYVCGWLYYISLLWFWKRKEKGRVVFLHIPMLEGEEELVWGRDVVVGLVRGLVESL